MTEGVFDLFAHLRVGDSSWMEGALCAQIDPEIFYPGPSQNPNTAKRVCLIMCEVTAQCRAYALDNFEEEGVWGGLSASERRQIWRERGQVVELPAELDENEEGAA